MEIKYVPWGVANNFGTYIELNENLPKYPSLHKAILDHELSHTDTPGFTKEDLIVDLKDSKVNNWELLKFMCKHPKAFLQLAPIYKQGGTIFYDLNMMLLWGIMLVAFIVALVWFL